MDPKLIAKLDQIESRYDDLNRQLSDPAITGDGFRYQKLARSHSEISGTVEKYREWKGLDRETAEARAMLGDSDAEMRALAEEELRRLEGRKESNEQELKTMLIPKDPNDQRNVVLEIRA